MRKIPRQFFLFSREKNEIFPRISIRETDRRRFRITRETQGGRREERRITHNCRRTC